MVLPRSERLRGLLTPAAVPILPPRPPTSGEATVAEWGPLAHLVARSERRDTVLFVGDPLFWPHGETLTIKVENGSDVPQRVLVYVATRQNRPDAAQRAVLELDVAAAGSRVSALDPGAGDVWGPYVVVTVEAISAPSSGACEVIVIRAGGFA